MISETLENTEKFYAKAHSLAPHSKMGLDTLATEGFDSEQIWEQMMLFNAPMMKFIDKDLLEFLQSRDDEQENLPCDVEQGLELEEPSEFEEPELDSKHSEQGEFDDELEQDDELEDDYQNTRNLTSNSDSSKPHRTIVDDEFFSLREMESFADRAEAWDKIQQGREINDDESQHEFDLGLDADIDSEEDKDDGMRDIMYEDFFGPRPAESATQNDFTKVSKRKRDMEELDPEEDYYNDPETDTLIDNDTLHESYNQTDQEELGEQDELENQDDLIEQTEQDEKMTGNIPPTNLFDYSEVKETLSTFEKHQQKLSAKIASLESESIAPRPWQVMGEASIKSRPANALLEESLVVEYASKPVPIITPDTTESLEDVIKKRIGEEDFDDPIRKQSTQASVRKARVLISDEKSSVSLDKIYEDEYMTVNGKKEAEKKPDSHFEIERLYGKLCANLDALCNFHYTPTRIESNDTVIVANAPAISVEDIIPVATSNATLVAPGEVYSGGITEGQGEKKTGRKRRKRNGLAKTAPVEDGTSRAALKSLARQSNVVIIGDGKSKDARSKASFIKAGDCVDQKKGKGKSMAELRL